MLGEMRTGTKIVMGFAFALVVAVIVGVVGYDGIRGVQLDLEEIATNSDPSARAVVAVSAGQFEAGYGVRGLLMPSMLDPQVRAQQYERVADGLKAAEQGYREYAALARDAEEEAVWREVVPLWESWKRSIDDLLTLARERDRLVAAGADPARVAELDARSFDLAKTSRNLMVDCDEKLLRLENINAKAAAASLKGARDGGALATLLMFAAIMAGAIAMAIIGLLLSRNISRTLAALIGESRRLSEAAVGGKLATRGDPKLVSSEFRPIVDGVNATLDALVAPIKVASEYIDRISRGDIPEKITTAYQGEFNEIKGSLNRCVDVMNGLIGQTSMLVQAEKDGRLDARADASAFGGGWGKLVAGMNEMLEILHDAMVQVADAVDQMSSASSQIASGSQAIAQSASEQASALEESSSSLEEMSSTTKQNAEHARKADELAQSMRGAADKGGKAMERMTSAMGRIRAAAEGTAQIIKDINEIAFQTNLLALNAAVEAARAGDAGRGFAVVAEEVRSLAQRSKEAAKKTEDLIKESVDLTEGGEVITREVTGNLAEILSSIGQVTGTVSEIATASQEQARGIDQVNTAVAQMNATTQQNVANAEESSSAAEELATQAEQLAAMVGNFKLNRDTRAVATRRKPGAQPRLLTGDAGKGDAGKADALHGF